MKAWRWFVCVSVLLHLVAISDQTPDLRRTQDKVTQLRKRVGALPPPMRAPFNISFSSRVERYLPDKDYLTVDEVEAAERHILNFSIARPVTASVSAAWLPLEFKRWKRWCPHDCQLVWSDDESTDRTADIIWRGKNKPPKRHFDEQLLVGNNGEAYTGSGSRYFAGLREQMDFSGTYYRQDPFWTTWFALEWAPPAWNVTGVAAALRTMMQSTPTVEQRRSAGAAMFFAHKNCGGERGKLFAALPASVAHGVGKCANNHQLPPEWGRTRLHFWPNNEGFEFVQKVFLSQRYLAVAALENTKIPDYFTEKRFQALLGGAIPIVWSNDNSVDYLPHPDAAIYADTFPSHRALVDYLDELMQPGIGDKLLDKHYAWKRSGLVAREFVKILFHGLSFVGCRLCELVSDVEEHRRQSAATA